MEEERIAFRQKRHAHARRHFDDVCKVIEEKADLIKKLNACVEARARARQEREEAEVCTAACSRSACARAPDAMH